MNKLNKKLVMIGAGGHAKVCYDIAQKMNKWNKIIVLDDNLENEYFKISGLINQTKNYLNDADVFVAIGDNKTRESITKKMTDLNVELATLIHPQAAIASNVKINKGTVIMAGAVINSNTKIGKGCIINTSSSIDHDNNIDDFVHISPGAHLAGLVTIGEKTWIGAGAIIINSININSRTIIGAGAVVTVEIKERGTYVGMPAKKLEE